MTVAAYHSPEGLAQNFPDEFQRGIGIARYTMALIRDNGWSIGADKLEAVNSTVQRDVGSDIEAQIRFGFVRLPSQVLAEQTGAKLEVIQELCHMQGAKV